jgi:hypothetical protein
MHPVAYCPVEDTLGRDHARNLFRPGAARGALVYVSHSGQSVRVGRHKLVLVAAVLAGACTSSDLDRDAVQDISSTEAATSTVATGPTTAAPVQNRIVDVQVYETRVEVEFSDGVPDHLLAKAEVPESGECSPVPMPGVDEFVNVVMSVDTEETPNGLPSDLVTMRGGTGLVERVVVTCAFEGKVHMAIGLSRASSLQGYESTIQGDPPRLVVHLAAAARD